MASDWQGVRVAITGHTGFKGAWLAYMLQRLGAEVWGYALVSATTPNLYDALRLDTVVHSYIGDVRDEIRLAAFFDEARPQVVFHFAAQSLVRAGYDAPAETFDVNVGGTIACLERCLQRETGIVVAATSDKCYRNDGTMARPFVETDPLGGGDPYSASKSAAEIAIESYRTSFFRPRGLQLASVRAGNVIGGGDWSEDRLFTDLARAAFEGRRLRIRYPRAIRPWQHVIDALRGYLAVASAARRGERVDEAWNLGPPGSGETTVEEVVQAFARATGKRLDVERVDSGSKPEASVLQLDARKARERLGWETSLTVSRSVELTAEWYRAFYDGENARELTSAQIDSVAWSSTSP
ncbi:MAG TPA: CDP-glucose 4,6-dehydratase [Candidatus Baltobacteraceae bacterium]|nr:CDP-glucose 4,6-dehydratase [Candidatus Baltobacteraceae bacterium]